MKPIFFVEEKLSGYMIHTENAIFDSKEGGSYNIIPARFLGLSYVDYLRYVRQAYAATIRGKEGYSYPVFKDKEMAIALVKVLNKEWYKVAKVLQDNEFLSNR